MLPVLPFFSVRRLLAGLACAAGLAGTGAARAQTLTMHTYTAANGLPESRVYCLSQDGRGRLWIGTQAGVSVFDGREFKTYGGQYGLTDSHVRAVAAVPGKAAVWLGLEYDGLARLCADERIRRVPLPGLRSPARPTVLWARPGQVWLGSASQGLWQLRYGRTDTTAHHYTTTQGLPADSVLALGPGLGGRMWAATPQGIAVLDAATGQPLPAEQAALPAALQGSVQCFYKVSDSVAWVGASHDLLQVSRGPAGWRVRRYTAAEGLPAGRLLDVKQDAAGRVWVNTARSLSRGVPEPGGLRWQVMTRPVPLDADHASTVLPDREGNLWTAAGDGLSEYLTDERFVQYTVLDGLPDPYVGAVAEPRPGELWVGTRRGIGILPLTTAGARPPAWVLTVPSRPGHVAEVMSLLADRRGGVWVGLFSDGARHYDLRTGRWDVLAVPGLERRTVSSLAEDSRGRIWLLTHRLGVTVYDPATGRYTTYRRGQRGLPSDDFWHAYRDRAGRLWLASDDAGLVLADTEHDTFRPAPGLPRFSLGSISEDQQGQLWLGPIGGQVRRYDPATGRSQTYGPAAGLHSINPYFMQCDSVGQVWVGTHQGVDVLDIRGGRAVSYGRAEGFGGGETNQNAVLRDAAGRLWLGTVDGLMLFDPRRPPKASPAPPVYLTRLRVGLRDTTLQANLALPYRLNSVSFDYQGVSLARPGSVRYQYRLRGLGDEGEHWVGPVAGTSATYASLPPGRYTFEVRASLDQGRWSARPAAYSFEIEAPWWRRWWAWPLYGLVLAGLLYGVRRRTRHQERERAERELERQALGHLQELDRVKTDFFTNISHELRTPLTLILGPAELLADTAPDPASRQRGRLVLEQSRKLLTLINQLLDLSKLDAGALRLHPAPGDATQLTRQLVASFGSLAESRGIALCLDTPPGSVPLVFDAVKLDEVLTNLLANALRFTPAGGQVTLRVAELPPSVAAPAGQVELTVQDTGPGIAPEHLPHLFDRFYQVSGPASASAATATRQGTGIGLALVRELVALHGGTVEVCSKPGAGASFVVRLPKGLAASPAAPVAAATAVASVAGTTPTAPAADAPPATPAPIARGSEAAQEMAATPEGGTQAVAADVPSATGLVGTASSAENTDTLPAGATDADSPQVLIIEDSDEVRAFIAETLTPAGYQLHLAPDGVSGLALARAEVPDLIVSDVMMPGLSGYEVCAALKADAATSHIPVVLLTARSADDDRLLGLETGAQAYLPKPFRPRELRAQVQSLLQLSQQSRSRFTLATAPAPPEPATMAEAAAPTAAPVSPVQAILPNQLAAHQAAVAALPSLDRAFLEKLDAAVLTHLGDETYGVDQLGQDLNLSRTQLHRKLKALTGQAPGEYLRQTRMLRALALLQARVATVAEVAYQVGYANPAHFSTAFSRQFGYPPSTVGRE